MGLIKRLKSKVEYVINANEYQTAYMLRNHEIIETQRQFEKYRNIHQGKNFAIIATGPTLNDFKRIEDCIYIGINKAYRKENLDYQYYFLQDYAATKGYMEEIIENVTCQKFVANYILEKDINSVQIPQQYIDKLQATKYFTCWPNESICPDISKSPMANCGTVTFAAIQFALYCGAQNIYLVGCDTSAGGYFDGTKQRNVKMTMNQSYLIENYKRLKSYADMYYPNSKIVSVNPVGLRGIFEDIYQK